MNEPIISPWLIYWFAHIKAFGMLPNGIGPGSLGRLLH